MLRQDRIQIVIELVLAGHEERHTAGLKAGSTCSTKDLQHVENGEVDESTLAGVIHVGPLDDDRVCRQVDTPSKRCSTAQDLK